MTTPRDSPKPRLRSGRASLATLAAHLKLSPAAISRVLNQAPAARSIPQATQKRIFEAARALDYRPNILARSLRRGQSMTLGVLVPEVAEGYTALVLAGLEQGLQRAGYFSLLISHHHRPERIRQSLATLMERAVDGVVAIDTTMPEPFGLPLVTVSAPDLHPQAANIRLNHSKAAELALRFLQGQGHREIAIMKGQAHSSDTENRWKAISAAAGSLGLVLKPSLIVQLEEDEPTHGPGYRAAQQLLASGERFTALFAFNDISAIGAIRALREAGLEVPQHVSVVGFDDVESAAFQNPSLSTVRQPLRQMGQLAAEVILDRILSQGEGAGEQRTLPVEPELIVRESVQAAPAHGPDGAAR